MADFWDFFSHEAGQNRRRWLDDKVRGVGSAISHYIPPESRADARSVAQIGGMLNPVNDMGDAMAAGRDGRWGDMLVSTAVALA